MNLQRINFILNNKEKSDIFYDDRPVWIQWLDDSNDIAVRIEDVEQDMIFGLDSEEELSQVLTLYAKKMGIN